ncbi:NAD(P)-binding protein [Mycena sanguinolenta]|uniref:Arsenite methyltransferase n=1 Tax=Mycena sanguinolenta TaxID=230812 RepID=A0A8H7D4J7_9AGAR|nr:NAD(P)-binding protein [Mycena sanguinolenta]
MANYTDKFLVERVNEAYSAIAKSGATAAYASEVAQSFGYTLEQLESIPKDSHMGLGCGNPTVTATLKPVSRWVFQRNLCHNTLTFVGRNSFGSWIRWWNRYIPRSVQDWPRGEAIGLDMSADMIKRARANAAKRNLFPPNVSFVQCSLTETLPIESSSIDCVLSNCVINLLPQFGKNHIFKEIYRVLKPGGRLVLDDIIAKVELPRHIRENMKHYISCIGGAIQVQKYDEIMKSAGFKDSVFVDSLADLNIYVMAADAEPAPGACCGDSSPGNSVKTADVDLNAGSPPTACCGASPVNAVTSAETSNMNLNQWAASYQIYAMKPSNAEEAICAVPLKRWWDAFPTVQATNIQRISPTALAEMRRNDVSVAVVDVPEQRRVRRESFLPSRLPSMPSHQSLAQTFYNQLSAFHETFASSNSVVFYCGSSVGRGPRCAGWYQDFLDANDNRGPQVLTLEGGFRRWAAEFPGEVEFVDKTHD